MIQHIRESCRFSSIKGNLIILFKDNVASIASIKEVYLKGHKTKHISPKFFYTHELLKGGEIVQEVGLSDNLANLFTKSMLISTFKKLIHKIGMSKDIDTRESMFIK